jgi:ribosomal RNA-processing protein 9
MQLLFSNGHSAPIDAVALLHAEGFVSGSQDGSLTLWSSKRKKCVASAPRAHGDAASGGPNWISALASPAYSDVVISGSCDGKLRFWHADENERAITQLMEVPLPGFVNGLAVAPSGKFVAAAVGQEHRLGRWFNVPEGRNSLCLIALPQALHSKPRLSIASGVGSGVSRRGPRAVGPGAESDEEEADEEGADDEQL